MRRVLVLEADLASQRHLAGLLPSRGYDPVFVTTIEAALSALQEDRFVFSLVAVGLGGGDGLEFLRRVRIVGGETGPILVLARAQEVGRAAEAMGLGADDFLQSPVDAEDLENAVKAALSSSRAAPQRPAGDDPTARLREEIGLWRSQRMREVLDIVRQAARVDVTVLVCGETGTGKDVVARAIHYLSSRRDEPFVKVNCAAMPRELLESELFGHERGAFTGAHQLKIGKFEAANRGTIFLDEIGDLHPALQAKLLHVLQDGAFSRVGGKSTIKVDVRVLAATNRDLERAVEAERFREDLYYRLNVIQITLPPLRERIEEIPILAEYFVRRYAKMFNRDGFALSPRAVAALGAHRYPGNVRELENTIKRMIVLGDPLMARVLLPGSAAADQGNGTTESPTVPEAAIVPKIAPLKEVARQAARAAEREAIARVLEQTGWNRVRAAKLLKISYRALLYKIKDVGLDRDRGARSSP
jgi:two-component system response regulator AtoC